MEGEFNQLNTENIKVTFSPNTNNIATSDELSAAAMYQDKMGTNYSKSKSVVKMINITGITLILTAAAIKTGNFVSNAFITNPPTISDNKYQLVDNVFSYEFNIKNANKYKVKYYLFINNKKVIEEDCSREDTYMGTYDQLSKGDKGKFYIEFRNGFDYKKSIDEYKFTVE